MKKLFLFVASIVATGGCKQGLGDRCQVNDDCSSPYVCNQAKMQCQETTSGGLDASLVDAPTILVDAPVTIVDAPPADAPVDAAVDAP